MINEILLKYEDFHWYTSIDLNMWYYHIRISKNKTNLCTIILPWVKYCYKRLPMGVPNSWEILERNMNDLFQLFESFLLYTDDILIPTKGDWTDHLQKNESTLNKLKEPGIRCNIEHSFLRQTKREYLAFRVTHDGVKPIEKKINKNMMPPTSQK